MFRNLYSSRPIIKSSNERFFWWCATCLDKRRIQKRVSSVHVRPVTSNKKMNLVTNFKFKRTPSDAEKRLESHENSPEEISAEGTTGYLSSDDLLLSNTPLQVLRHKTPLTREDLQIESSPFYRKYRRLHPSVQKVVGQILFGVHPVAMALSQRRREIHRVYLKHPEKNVGGQRREVIESLAADAGVPIKYVNTWTLDQLVEGFVHQGVCMDVGPLKLPSADEEGYGDRPALQESPFAFPLCVLMENVKDPMNFGAVLRSAYYFGVDGVFCARKNSCKLSPIVSKASSGAMEAIDLCSVTNVEEFLRRRKQNGWCIVGTSSNEAEGVPLMDVLSFRVNGPVLLILGNEGAGISRGVLSVCDVLLAIHPASKHQHHSGVDSLNVSAAAAILLHTLMTKRPKMA